MKYSESLIPTLRETPSDAEVISHQLMLRAGYIRKVAAGIYNYLPLGFKVLKKVENIIREEMERAGAQEVLMPMVVPSELWKKSGRWDFYGKELLRINDRHGRDFCLGPTHEEVITELTGTEIRSYRNLPINLFQIQTKFRDEVRPRFGLMRGREFVMKDAYSFHTSEEDAEREYRKMFDTYKRIFERCGLKFRAVEADSGSIGGSFSHEFVVLAESGEDAVASCDNCDYAANIEKAISKSKRNLPDKKEAALPQEKVKTPGKKSIDEVAAFMGVKEEHLVKTLVYLADNKPVIALIRGDYELNETKLKNVLDCNELELAGPETVTKITGAPTGFAGPIGLNDIEIYADHTVEVMSNFICGANEKDLHIKNVNIEQDFNVTEFHDLRSVTCGDECPRCEGKLEIHRGIEVGHIFKLGTKYSEAMGATFLDTDGKEKPMVMGCYGIGVGRTGAAAIEQNNDEGGIIWPMPLAPYQVIITIVNPKDDEVRTTAESIYESLKLEGIEVILDDRNERPGIKFKDADLIGIPVRITVGGRGIKEGKVEVKHRKEKDAANIEIEKVVEEVINIVKSAL